MLRRCLYVLLLVCLFVRPTWADVNEAGIGLQFLEKGDGLSAQNHLNRALAENPRNGRAWFLMGLSKAIQGEYAAALPDYDRALALHADEALVLYNRACANYSLQLFGAARRDFEEGAALASHDVEMWRGLGMCNFAQGRYPAAITDYNRALRLQPAYPKLYTARGDAWRALDNNQAALRDYDEAIRLQPRDANAHNSRGVLRSELGEVQLAIEDLRAAVACQPYYAYYHNLAMVYWQAGRVVEAGRAYAEFLRSAPQANEPVTSKALAGVDPTR